MFNSSCLLTRELQSFEYMKNYFESMDTRFDDFIIGSKNLHSHYNKNTDVTETIPLISHHIWFTKLTSPREVSQDDLNNLVNKIKLMNQAGCR